MRNERLAPLSALGAVSGAALSSACCWLPLALVTFGASAAGVTAFFDAYRAPFLVAAIGLLGIGFYFTYRTPRCEPGDACAAPDARLQRVNRWVLWCSTVLVLGFAAFPEYIAVADEASAEPATQLAEATFSIEGMTCASCGLTVEVAAKKVTGVVTAKVSYDDRNLVVAFDERKTTPEQISQAVTDSGYKATLRGPGGG